MRSQFDHHPTDAAVDDFRTEMWNRRQARIAEYGQAFVDAEDKVLDTQAKLSFSRSQLAKFRNRGLTEYLPKLEAEVAEREAAYEAAAAEFVRLKHGIGAAS